MAGVYNLVGRRRNAVAGSLAAAFLLAGSVGVEARPVRGPLTRAERRIERAQAALDRELARPPKPPAAAAPRAPAKPLPQSQVRARPQSQPQPKAQVPSPSPAAAPRAEVERATFESPVRQQPAAVPTPAGEPAADGTYSVLVRPNESGARPGSGNSDQSAEPLLFPAGSAP